jgi:hypothetical protein
VISRDCAFALVTRPDLVAKEAELVSASNRNWRGRLHDLGDYGRSGGSAADRRRIVEAFAALEAGLNS